MLILQILIGAFVAFMTVSLFYTASVRSSIIEKLDTHLNSIGFQNRSPSDQMDFLKTTIQHLEYNSTSDSALEREHKWILLREMNRRLSVMSH